MKGFIIKSTMLLLLIAFISGCDNDSNTVAPEASTELSNDLQQSFIDLNEFYPQSLSKGSWWKNIFVSNSEVVSNQNGGLIKLSIKDFYGSGNRVEAKILIPPGAFQPGDDFLKIEMKHYYLNWSLYFEPHPYLFVKDLTLNVTFTGIYMGAKMARDLKFAYLSYDGRTLEICKSAKVQYNPANKTLQITNAKVPHFSRFGFIR